MAERHAGRSACEISTTSTSAWAFVISRSTVTVLLYREIIGGLGRILVGSEPLSHETVQKF